MEDLKKNGSETPVDKLFNSVSAFAEAYFQIIQLEIKNGISTGLTVIILVSIFLIFFTFIVLFLNIGIALLFSKLLEINTYWGFFFVALLNLLVMLLLFSRRQQITNAIDQTIDNQINKNEE